jgi:stress response protein YsnF
MTTQHPSAEGLHDSGEVTPQPSSGTAGGFGSGADTAEVIRSEEQLDVARRAEVVGRVRISKRVVSEERQVTVTVRREELVVEELSTDASTSYGDEATSYGDTAGGGPGARTGGTTQGAAVLELVLSEEEVEVVTRVVPRERVRVFVDTVTGAVEVADTVAKEVVDVQGVDGDDLDRTDLDRTDLDRSERGMTR